MDYIKYLEQGFVGIVTINRPAQLNALNTQTLEELEKTIDSIDLNAIRCLIITGEGQKSFVAGADIGEMLTLDPKGALAFSQCGNHVFRKIEKLSIPVIAAVNGFALGGGCELALSCDIRLASENASFAQPEAGLGITPGFGGTQRLARTIGESIAKELIYTCRRIKAPEALELGLVNHVYPIEDLMTKAIELAESIAKNVPFAVRACKKAIGEGLQHGIDQALDIEIENFAGCFTTQDRLNSMKAFVEKRKPEPFENK